MRLDRLPLTYDECRARFRRAAAAAGHQVAAHPIQARGPEGQELTVDVVALGAASPRRALVLLSGTHGVEGFVNSTLQTDLLGRFNATSLPDDVAILLVHAVNPWGMAWWRRQNESNVDLNRNWRRSAVGPRQNDAYDELHALACPNTEDIPDGVEMLGLAAALVQQRGLPWVRDAITKGQYRHADGLHFGGDRTEESCLILEGLVVDQLAGVERLFTVDLHTGHGPRGEVVFLCDSPPGSGRERFLQAAFVGGRVESTTGNPDATTGLKSGAIANGFGDLLPGTLCHATAAEFGTAPDQEQLMATYRESWVHRHGDRSVPDHAAAIWAYRCCFTPDDPEWEATCIRRGQHLLDQAVSAVTAWD